jgi:hypothetical protein
MWGHATVLTGGGTLLLVALVAAGICRAMLSLLEAGSGVPARAPAPGRSEPAGAAAPAVARRRPAAAARVALHG